MRDLEVKVVRWLMHIRSANRAAMCWLSNVHSLITNPPLLMTVTYLEPGVRVLVYSTEAKVCRTSGQATLKKGMFLPSKSAVYFVVMWVIWVFCTQNV